MPQLTSPLSTPTGMPATNQAHLGKLAGTRIHFGTFADFTAAITTGTAFYAADLWADGQEMTIASEADSGAVRVWRTALGHARTVKVGRLEVVLPANTNVVLAAAGIPAAGTGTNGDLSVDKAAGIAYLKTAGTWASAGNIGELSAAAASAVQSAFNAGSSFTSTTLGPVASSRTALASDNGGTFELANGVTYTLDSAVPLPAGVILIGPASGSATIAVAGSATINGGTTSVTVSAGQAYTVIPRATSAAAFVVKGS